MNRITDDAGELRETDHNHAGDTGDGLCRVKNGGKCGEAA